jgi:hypothetical protein
MIEPKQLLEYAQHPELALQNLPELFALLDSDDETLQNYATEALENCGPPRPQDHQNLQQRLRSEKASEVYWSSTLLGRAKEQLEKPGQVASVQLALGAVIQRDSLDVSARERAAWAIHELGPADSDLKTQLQKMIPQAAPRLKRLLEAI